MDRFVFQAGGGADAAYTHAVVTRAWLQARGELGQRDEIVTSIQAHPCNAATAAAAGFKVVTLMLEEDGYPSVEALRAAVSNCTAALMINNPDDMGIYNPHIAEWVRIVHEVGGLAFYDHANFNGVMGKIRARELGFDACMYMLHKTFGAPKGGGGPAVGAYGCSAELAPFLPMPVVVEEGGRYRLDDDRPQTVGKVREFWGNVPQVVKAYAWAVGMGGDGIQEGSDLSVLANNYMDAKLARIPGLARSHPERRGPADGDDALGPRAAQGGDRGRHGRRRQPHGGLRRRSLVDEPRALGGAGAVHARGRRDVRQGGPRLLDRRGRADLRGGAPGPRPGQDGAAPPADRPDRRQRPRRPGTLGDDLAGYKRKTGRSGNPPAQAAEQSSPVSLGQFPTRGPGRRHLRGRCRLAPSCTRSSPAWPRLAGNLALYTAGNLVVIRVLREVGLGSGDVPEHGRPADRG